MSIENITPTGNGKIVTLNFNELIKEQLSYFIIAISFKNIMFVSATSNPMKREPTPFAVNNIKTWTRKYNVSLDFTKDRGKTLFI